MASTFQQFAQRVERLASEWQELNAELQDTDAKTEKTQEKVQKLKVQRGEICADLDEIEKKQKSLMPDVKAKSHATRNGGDKTPNAAIKSERIDENSAETSFTITNNGDEIVVHNGVSSAQQNSLPSTPMLDCSPAAISQAEPISFDTNFDIPPKDLFFLALKANKGIYPSYKNVVYMDRAWTEISCSSCGANALYDDKIAAIRFFGGIVGLHNHIKAKHEDGIADSTMVATLKLFKRRVVGKEDAALMKQGKAPKINIEFNKGHVSKKTIGLGEHYAPPQNIPQSAQMDRGKNQNNAFVPQAASRMSSLSLDRTTRSPQAGAAPEGISSQVDGSMDSTPKKNQDMRERVNNKRAQVEVSSENDDTPRTKKRKSFYQSTKMTTKMYEPSKYDHYPDEDDDEELPVVKPSQV